MKILMLTDYFLPHVGGGVEKVVYEVSRRLVGQGHEVSIITLNTDAAPEHEVIDGITVYRAGMINLTSLIGLPFAISFDLRGIINEVVHKTKPDIVHAHHIFFYTAFTAARLKPSLQAPLITTMHIGGLNYLGGLRGGLASAYERTIGKWILKQSDKVTVVSKNLHEYATSLGVESSKVDVIPNGVDYDYFRNVGSSKSEEPRIVSVGRLLFNKGVQFLIDAAPAVLKEYPNAEFVIVGDGPMRTELEKQAKDRGVYSNFVFAGNVPDIRPFLASSDVYVRSSLLEGMPLAVLEAMACGTSVIATDVAGTSELVRNYSTGLLIKPRDVDALSQRIIQLLSDKSLANKLAANAKEMVEQYFTWEKVTEAYVQAYRKLIDQ